MKISCHRGVWTSKDEQNTMDSFLQAFEKGWGIETDIRDLDGELVIAHDPARSGALKFEDVLKAYKGYDSEPFLCLNIKSDGLQHQLKDMLNNYDVTQYACFDMSIPQLIVYRKVGVQFLSRWSEYEEPLFEDEATGYWIDIFDHTWPTPDNISKCLDTKKPVCLVSPELHKREGCEAFWTQFIQSGRHDNIIMCTDFPFELEKLL